MAQMSQMPTDRTNKLRFGYESDADASFLVLNCDAKVLEYQALMLEHNRIRHVLPVDVIIKEGMNCYYYNITSKISMSFFLSRRKLSREEFLKLLLNIASAVNESAGYLLTASNFVFDMEYIYINPETLEPMLVYLPAAMDGGSGTTLQAFVSELLMQHLNVSGFGDGNLVQRVLSEVKSELFNTKSLILAINDLLYAYTPDAAGFAARRDNAEEWAAVPEAEGKAESGKAGTEKVHGEGGMAGSSLKISRPTALMVLAQAVMGALIYLGRNFLDHVSSNPTATYAAVIMIVIAVDVLLFKKFNAAKLVRSEISQECHAPDIMDSASGKIETGVRESSYIKNGHNMQSARTASNRVREMIRGTRGIDQDAICEVPPANRDTPYEVPGVNCGVYRANHGITCEADETAAVSETEPVKVKTASVPAVTPAGRTEILTNYKKGVRMLKSTRRQNGDEDIYIDKDDFIIGRLAGHVDHVIANSAVGKLHAQILSRNGSCHIKDLNSVNGTFVNGKRIECNKEIELQENDRVLLANSEYVYLKG